MNMKVKCAFEKAIPYAAVFLVGAVSVWLLIWFFPNLKINRWELYCSSSEADYFLDTRSIKPRSQDVRHVRVKAVYTPAGVQEIVLKLGQQFTGLKETRQLYEVDCKERKVRPVNSRKQAPGLNETIKHLMHDPLCKAVCK